MLTLKRQIIAALCVYLSVQAPAAAETNNNDFIFYDPPSKNPYMEGYLSETMESMSKDMAMTNTLCLAYFDGGIDVQADSLDAEAQNFSIGRGVYFFGGMYPLPLNLAIPLFFGAVASESNDKELGVVNEGGSLILASGLVYQGRLGTISGILGYSAFGIGDAYFYWGVFPVINAQEFPFLSAFVKLISGYLRADRDMFKPMYKANALFKDIRFDIAGFDTRWSLSVFAEKNWFNVDAKYDLYAAKIGLALPRVEDRIFTDITIGYRKFFDILNNPDFYESGGYIKIAIGFDNFEGGGLQLSIESCVKPFLTDCTIGFYIGYGTSLFDGTDMKRGSRYASKSGLDIKGGANELGLGLFTRLYTDDKDAHRNLWRAIFRQVLGIGGDG